MHSRDVTFSLLPRTTAHMLPMPAVVSLSSFVSCLRQPLSHVAILSFLPPCLPCSGFLPCLYWPLSSAYSFSLDTFSLPRYARYCALRSAPPSTLAELSIIQSSECLSNVGFRTRLTMTVICGSITVTRGGVSVNE